MPEPITPENPENKATPPTGAAPTPTVNADQDFDTSKLTDAQLAKIYEDPRLYQHSRFKELTEAKKQRDDLAKEKADREKKELEEKGEFQKLKDLAEKERDDAKTQLNNLKLDSAIERAAVKAGAVDPEAVAKLIDRTNIKADDTTGEIQGLDDAIKAMQETKGYLFGKGNTVTVGSPTNPANPNSGKRYKHSQIQDPKFFRENEADIRLAIKENRVEHDL